MAEAVSVILFNIFAIVQNRNQPAKKSIKSFASFNIFLVFITNAYYRDFK